MTAALEFRDCYAGWTPVRLVSFVTTARGQRVTRFRFETVSGRSIGTFAAGGFASVEAAQAAAARYPGIFRAA